jgi:hypothetical protein
MPMSGEDILKLYLKKGLEKKLLKRLKGTK